MSRYLERLGDDIDLGNIGKQVVNTIENVAQGAATDAIATAAKAAETAVHTAITGGGSTPPPPNTTSTTVPVTYQAPEKPVATTMSNVMQYAGPAGVGVGVWLWKKSFLWAGLSAATTMFVTRYLAKRRAQKGGM